MKKSIEEIEQDLRDAGFVVYGSHQGKLLPGMYMALFHGFISEEDHDEHGRWGANGPVFGPLEWVHDTYRSHVRMLFKHVIAAYKADKAFGHEVPDDLGDYAADAVEVEFDQEDGVYICMGIRYGDMTVFIVE